MWCWFVFSETEITTTAAATATVTTCYDSANDEACLQGWIIIKISSSSLKIFAA